MPIRILPENLVNQIAAGEVVERPSSIVKELIENSIDAGATNIILSIRNAGLDSITVEDDGNGISQQELPLAIVRFATSKLSKNNLNDISSFGFRGEALPAIASVSRLSILSKNKGSKNAYSIQVDNGNHSKIKVSSRSQGTTITVKSLFIKTPARLKFLRSNRIELAHCKNILTKFALSHPYISFKLFIDGKNNLNLNKEDNVLSSFDSRIKLILGNDFYQNCLKLDEIRKEFSLFGYIGIPTFNKNTSESQYFFVNGRFIKDKSLLGAVRAAYGDTIPKGRYPALVLFINVPNHLIDVNVHPAKTEIRFYNINHLKGLIIKSIRELISYPTYNLKEDSNLINKFNVSTEFRNENKKEDIIDSKNLNQSNLDLYLPPSSKEKNQETTEENSFPLGAVKAQLRAAFIISETSEGIMLVDQHAAHERIVMEEMKNNFEKGRIISQILLIPEVVSLSSMEYNYLVENIEFLNNIGLKLEPFGEDTVIVREVPQILDSSKISLMIKDIASYLLSQEDYETINQKVNEVFAKLSCYGSVRAGRKLSYEEMDGLLRKMEKTPNSNQCNHGRPTIIKLSFNEIEKLFERK